jgi:DNA-binding MarR family transcriptional regulator
MSAARRPRATNRAQLESPKPESPKPESRVDLGPLPGYIGYALRRAQLAIFQDFIGALAEVDIRPAQFSVLILLETNPGLRPSQVSAALGIQRTNFVALSAALARRGLTRRGPAADDRRAHALYLSERGAALLQRMKTLQSAHERRVIGLIGAAGRRRLLALLAKLTAVGES